MNIQRGNTQGLLFQFGSGYVQPPLDATSYFAGASGLVNTTGSYSRIVIPRAGTVTRIDLDMVTYGAGSNESSSIYFRLNNTTDTLITSALDNSTALVNASASVSIAVAVGDYFEIKWVAPTWATDPTYVVYFGSVYME